MSRLAIPTLIPAFSTRRPRANAYPIFSGCSDVVKKPKLDQHHSRCHTGFDCIDCSVTFNTPAEYKGHTSCITEAEKYQKSLYKGPKNVCPCLWSRGECSGGVCGFFVVSKRKTVMISTGIREGLMAGGASKGAAEDEVGSRVAVDTKMGDNPATKRQARTERPSVLPNECPL
ncbi:hypothetical protein BDN67DRAFT_956306 [Paxillus ammoniavirescens]|nr:hypothetical protein BDN67DRAFT_956306 [Paxillus ammoniavirescens]